MNRLSPFLLLTAGLAFFLAASPKISGAVNNYFSNKVEKNKTEVVKKSATASYDYEKLQGMDPYSTPNIFNQGGTAWENATREEKLQMLDQANLQDSSWTWVGPKFSCGEISKLKLVDMFGCKDFEKYDYFNGFEERYKKEKNGFGNIPVYRVTTMPDPDALQNVSTTTLYGHEINAVFVGPKNPNEKKDPTKFEQWIFFEPQLKGENGTYYVQPGDWQMDDNGPVSIYWFGDKPNYYTGEWAPDDMQLLQFNLTNGVAKPDSSFAGSGVTPYLIREDPNSLYLGYTDFPDTVFYEAGEEPYPKSAEREWITNTEYYADRIREFSDVSDARDVNPNYSLYEYDYDVEDSVSFELGNHLISGSKLYPDSVNGTRKYLIQVRDTKAPVVLGVDSEGYLPKVTIGQWGGHAPGENVTPENTSIGWPEVVDSCPQIDITWERTLLHEDETTQTYQIEYTATDRSLNQNQTVVWQEVTVDLTTAVQVINATAEKLNVFPNPAGEQLHVEFSGTTFSKETRFRVVTFSGQVVWQFNRIFTTGKTTLDLTGLSQGTYILQVSIDKRTWEKIFIRQ